jgi:hypothetical protein
MRTLPDLFAEVGVRHFPILARFPVGYSFRENGISQAILD